VQSESRRYVRVGTGPMGTTPFLWGFFPWVRLILKGWNPAIGTGPKEAGRLHAVEKPLADPMTSNDKWGKSLTSCIPWLKHGIWILCIAGCSWLQPCCYRENW